MMYVYEWEIACVCVYAMVCAMTLGTAAAAANEQRRKRKSVRRAHCQIVQTRLENWMTINDDVMCLWAKYSHTCHIQIYTTELISCFTYMICVCVSTHSLPFTPFH